MTKTINVPDRKLVDYIESLDYEINARKDIITYMLSNNMDITSDAFKHYHKEYEEFMVQYNEAKRQVEEMYITDNIKKEMNCETIDWDLNFETANLTLRSR